jgi:hypothetical protein
VPSNATEGCVKWCGWHGMQGVRGSTPLSSTTTTPQVKGLPFLQLRFLPLPVERSTGSVTSPSPKTPAASAPPPAPQVMATLRNLAIGLLRLAGHTQIAPTLRWVNRNPARALAFLGLP